MKKLKFTFLFYFSLIALSVVIQSCFKCNDYKIIDLVNLYADGTPENVVIDSTTIIRGEFALVANAEFEVAALFSNPGIIQTAYAFGCGAKFITNSIDESSIRVSCDRDFKYDNVDILADASFHELVNVGVSKYFL